MCLSSIYWCAPDVLLCVINTQGRVFMGMMSEVFSGLEDGVGKYKSMSFAFESSVAEDVLVLIVLQ
jgi:hypothetical protein